MIDALMSVRGVRYASLVDEAGQPLMSVGDEAPDLTMVASARAVIGSLKAAMNESTWNDLLIDVDDGPVLLTPVGEQLLITAFDDVASLGRVRFAVRRALGKV